MPEPPVVNTSPFIVLANGGWLDLLRLAGDPVLVPREVAEEVLRPGIADAAADALRTVEWVEVVEAGEPPAELRRLRLDAGEEAVLTWALAHPGTLAVIDDRRGRHVARTLGIPVTGTLGLIVEAKLRRIIPAARPVVEQILQATGWYLSPEVIGRVLAEIDE